MDSWVPPEGGDASVAGANAPAPAGAAEDTSASPPSSTRPRPPLPVVPVPLRPMTLGEILDGAFAVLKLRPRDVLTVTAVFVVPLQLVLAYLQRGVLDGQALSEAFSNPTLGAQSTSTSTATTVVSTVGSGLVLALVAGALAHMVSAWYGGVDVTPRQAVERSVRRFGPLAVAWIVVHVIELVGLFVLALPVLIAMGLFLVVSPAVVVEGLGPFAAMGRSLRLAGRRLWPMVGVAVLSGVVASIVSQILALIPTVIGLVIGLDAGWPLLAIGGVASSLITVSFVAAVSVLAYLDLRVRQEGLDLQMRVDALPGPDTRA